MHMLGHDAVRPDEHRMMRGAIDQCVETRLSDLVVCEQLRRSLLETRRQQERVRGIAVDEMRETNLFALWLGHLHILTTSTREQNCLLPLEKDVCLSRKPK